MASDSQFEEFDDPPRNERNKRREEKEIKKKNEDIWIIN